MVNLNLDQLRTLVAVIEHGTFDAAADALHITPSAVSQRIRSLEDAAGRVIVRRDRPVTTTDSGDALLRTARQMLHLEETFGREFVRTDPDEEAEQEHLVLPVACNADSLGTWFLDALAAFPQRLRVTFDIRREDEDSSAGLLRRGVVMAAVTSEASPVQGCRVEPLGAMRYLPCVCPELAERYFDGSELSATLHRLPAVDFDHRDGQQARFYRRLSRHPYDGPRHYIPSSSDYLRALQAGLGWGLVPEAMALPALADGSLVEFAPDRRPEVPLFWQSWKVRSDELQELTLAVRAAAGRALHPVDAASGSMRR